MEDTLKLQFDGKKILFFELGILVLLFFQTPHGWYKGQHKFILAGKAAKSAPKFFDFNATWRSFLCSSSIHCFTGHWKVYPFDSICLLQISTVSRTGVFILI